MRNLTRSKISLTALAAALAGVSVLSAQDATQLQRLTIGRSPSDGIPSTEPGQTWRLSSSNMTGTISAAYRFGKNVVVFGWIGFAGVTTIIDAATGRENLEFLGNDFRISPKGLIVFTRFYPHFSDPSIISDAVAELDLNEPIPHNVPSRLYENPTDQVGTTIYPEAPTPGVRHDILHNFLVSHDGAFVELVDRLSSGKLCLIRLSLADSDHRLQMMNCVTSDAFGVSDLSLVHIHEFSENAAGGLVLSVDIGKLPSIVQRSFDIDRTSLALNGTSPSKRNEAAKQSEQPFVMPWGVLKRALTVFVPVQTEAHPQETVKVRLVIGTAGDVRDVSVSGLPSDVADLVRAASSGGSLSRQS